MITWSSAIIISIIISPGHQPDKLVEVDVTITILVEKTTCITVNRFYNIFNLYFGQKTNLGPDLGADLVDHVHHVLELLL